MPGRTDCESAGPLTRCDDPELEPALVAGCDAGAGGGGGGGGGGAGVGAGLGGQMRPSRHGEAGVPADTAITAGPTATPSATTTPASATRTGVVRTGIDLLQTAQTRPTGTPQKTFAAPETLRPWTRSGRSEGSGIRRPPSRWPRNENYACLI